MDLIPVSTTFFQQPTLTVAPELLGKYLMRQMPDEDLVALPMLRQAQHKFEKWKLTMDFAMVPPTPLETHSPQRSLVCPWGCFYIYICYGVHWMLNIVCSECFDKLSTRWNTQPPFSFVVPAKFLDPVG
jgi:DNA-3-methyladenine glycosylase